MAPKAIGLCRLNRFAYFFKRHDVVEYFSRIRRQCPADTSNTI